MTVRCYAPTRYWQGIVACNLVVPHQGLGCRICVYTVAGPAVRRDNVLESRCEYPPFFIDLLMGLFRGAVFRHGWGALKQPIKEPTETLTSTLALMGRFPLLMGRFPTLMGRFTDFVLRGCFTS